MAGPNVGYKCLYCGFDTEVTNCDDCDAVVKWDNNSKRSAHCTGCGINIVRITCRKCGNKFNL
jgi:primosomal protein N'